MADQEIPAPGPNFKPKAWMPLYVADWQADTTNFTCAEDGAYFRLVCWYWRNGPLPNDHAQLARIVGASAQEWRWLRDKVLAKFNLCGEFWSHTRVELELARATIKRAKAIEKATIAADARHKTAASSIARSNATSMLQAMHKHCPSPSPSKAEPSRGSALRGADAPASVPEGSPPPRVWNGPASVTEMVLDKQGDAYAASWLWQCAWQDVPAPAILPPSGICRDRLWRDFSVELDKAGIVLADAPAKRAKA